MPLDNLPREIAFWGPSSSGKTWLMQSLARALLHISQEDPDFEYALAQPEALAPVNAFQAPQNQPTSDASDRVWLFQRKVRPERDTPAHRLSAHSHSIVVRDAPGELLMQGVDNVVMLPLRDAQCVIAVLDHTLLASTAGAFQAQPQGAPLGQGLAGLFGAGAAAAAAHGFGGTFQYSQAQYTQMISNLLQLLSSKPRPDRHVAICVTKVDQLKVMGRDPWQVVELYFGSEMVQRLRSHASYMRIEAFCVSAAGYLDTFREQPNYDPATHGLLAPDRWQPYAVEAPFFWLFAHLERRRLANGGGSLPRWYFKGDRLKHYIGYPTRQY